MEVSGQQEFFPTKMWVSGTELVLRLGGTSPTEPPHQLHYVLDTVLTAMKRCMAACLQCLKINNRL